MIINKQTGNLRKHLPERVETPFSGLESYHVDREKQFLTNLHLPTHGIKKRLLVKSKEYARSFWVVGDRTGPKVLFAISCRHA